MADEGPDGGRPMTDDGEKPGALSGVRILDLTQALAGPFATMLLADLGADVIKIEPPGGDGTRRSAPHVAEDEAYGGYFHSINRNKRSVSIDLKSEEGRAVFERMVEDADAVVENFRVGTMERLGIEYERLEEIKPDLVYASVRGFGDPRTGDSPYAERPAFDVIAQAMSGFMSVTGTDESGPVKAGPSVGDIFPGTLCALGVLAALRHRDRTGEGQYVDVSMVDGMLAMAERMVHRFSITGEVPGPTGNTHPLFFPFDRFEASDGYVVIAAPGNKHWEALCEHMERPDLIEEYPTGGDRMADAETIREEITEWTSQRPKHELFETLGEDLPCAPVNDAADVFAEEHFQARDMLAEVEHADTGKTVSLANSPIKFTESASGVRSKGPFLGEHTEEVLREFGFDDTEVDDLIESEGVNTYRSSE